MDNLSADATWGDDSATWGDNSTTFTREWAPDNFQPPITRVLRNMETAGRRAQRKAKGVARKRVRQEAANRLSCLRRLRRRDMGQKALARLATDKELPTEIVLQILGTIVLRSCRVVLLPSLDLLSEVRKTVLGKSSAADDLEEVFADASFKNASVRLHYDAPKQPMIVEPNAMPSSHNPSRREIEIECYARVSCSAMNYPSQLFRATKDIPTIATKMGKPDQLKLIIRLYIGCCHTNKHCAWYSMDGFSGFHQKESLRSVVNRLLKAFHEVKGPKKKSLKTVVSHPFGFDTEIAEIAIDGITTMEDIKRVAFTDTSD